MGSRPPDSAPRSWWSAGLRAALIVAALAVLFAYVPDELAQRLDRRATSPDVRDLVLVAWFTLSAIVVPAVLFRLQRRGVI